jgi:hypothetical protein
MELKLLPRDIQVKILGTCDMDTRIKGGYIRSLKVPESFQQKLGGCLLQPKCLDTIGIGQYFYIWKLGRDDNSTWVYTVIKEIDDNNIVITSVYNRYNHFMIV